jgi:hypothetical protein
LSQLDLLYDVIRIQSNAQREVYNELKTLCVSY